MSSKLFLKIREEKGLAYTVRGSVNAEKHYSYYTIYVGTTKKALPEVRKIIIEEFGNIASIGDTEINEAKERLVGLKKIGSEESSSVMNELMYHELIGKIDDYYKYEEKIRAVSLAQVKKLAKSLIKEYSTAAIVPE